MDVRLESSPHPDVDGRKLTTFAQDARIAVETGVDGVYAQPCQFYHWGANQFLETS